MTTNAPKFNSLDAFHQETARLIGERAKAVTAADKKKANAALTAHMKELDAIISHDESQISNERRKDAASELEAVAKKHMYSSVTEMLDDVRSLFAPVAAAKKVRANAKAPKVYKYVLRADPTKGASRLTTEKHASGLYRDATPAESKAMEKAVADWEASHPKR
jgi:hypothetical protein